MIYAFNPDCCHLRLRTFLLTSSHHVNWQPQRSAKPHRGCHLWWASRRSVSRRKVNRWESLGRGCVADHCYIFIARLPHSYYHKFLYSHCYNLWVIAAFHYAATNYSFSKASSRSSSEPRLFSGRGKLTDQTSVCVYVCVCVCVCVFSPFFGVNVKEGHCVVP